MEFSVWSASLCGWVKKSSVGGSAVLCCEGGLNAVMRDGVVYTRLGDRE